MSKEIKGIAPGVAVRGAALSVPSKGTLWGGAEVQPPTAWPVVCPGTRLHRRHTFL